MRRTVSGVSSSQKSRGGSFGVSTTQKRRLPVVSLKNCDSFVVPMKTHCLGYSCKRRPYAGRNRSRCLVMKSLMVSASAFLIPASSPTSMIQTPSTCSYASLPCTEVKLSENHSPPSFAMRDDLPRPCEPLMVSM